ncbi:MAG: hypothetical protein IJ766_06645 [Clostridia bacterium]|nr:hypothetical protein [Clostridia bacterium]
MHIQLLVVGIVATIVFLILRIKKGGLPAAVAKTCASVLFILTGLASAMDAMPYFKKVVIGYANFNPWVLLYIAGLVCALLGDLFLDLKYVYLEDSDTHTYLGMVFFLATQIFYFIGAFNVFRWGSNLTYIYIAIAVTAIFELVILFGERKLLKVKFGKFKAISAVYSGALAFTTTFTICCAFATGFSTGALMMAAGQVFFLISDLILSGTYFGVGKNTKKHVLWNHILYYLAQFLIATAIYYI